MATTGFLSLIAFSLLSIGQSDPNITVSPKNKEVWQLLGSVVEFKCDYWPPTATIRKVIYNKVTPLTEQPVYTYESKDGVGIGLLQWAGRSFHQTGNGYFAVYLNSTEVTDDGQYSCVFYTSNSEKGAYFQFTTFTVPKLSLPGPKVFANSGEMTDIRIASSCTTPAVDIIWDTEFGTIESSKDACKPLNQASLDDTDTFYATTSTLSVRFTQSAVVAVNLSHPSFGIQRTVMEVTVERSGYGKREKELSIAALVLSGIAGFIEIIFIIKICF